MLKYKKFITKGVTESLSKVPFHNRAPIKRISMLSEKTIPEAKIHAAVHFVDVSTRRIPKYSNLHKHDADEINIILPQDGNIVYEIQLEGEIYKVKSPATIFIPKGVMHRADAISGKGIFVCIIFANKYRTS